MPSPTAIVKCDTTAGPFEFHLYREWSPHGVDRAIELYEKHYYDNSHFFRAVPRFLVQFGISYTTDEELRAFAESEIPDDPQLDPPIKFEEGIMSYAGGGPNSRTSQMFIAYGPVSSLGNELWETPIGKVVKGMENVRNFYSKYGDMPPWGKGPKQWKIKSEGVAYMEREYPLMDKFLVCNLERPIDFGNGRQHIRSIRDVHNEQVDHEYKVEKLNLQNDPQLLIYGLLLIVIVAFLFRAIIAQFPNRKASKSN